MGCAVDSCQGIFRLSSWVHPRNRRPRLFRKNVRVHLLPQPTIDNILLDPPFLLGCTSPAHSPLPTSSARHGGDPRAAPGAQSVAPTPRRHCFRRTPWPDFFRVGTSPTLLPYNAWTTSGQTIAPLFFYSEKRLEDPHSALPENPRPPASPAAGRRSSVIEMYAPIQELEAAAGVDFEGCHILSYPTDPRGRAGVRVLLELFPLVPCDDRRANLPNHAREASFVARG